MYDFMRSKQGYLAQRCWFMLFISIVAPNQEKNHVKKGGAVSQYFLIEKITLFSAQLSNGNFSIRKY